MGAGGLPGCVGCGDGLIDGGGRGDGRGRGGGRPGVVGTAGLRGAPQDGSGLRDSAGGLEFLRGGLSELRPQAGFRGELIVPLKCPTTATAQRCGSWESFPASPTDPSLLARTVILMLDPLAAVEITTRSTVLTVSAFC